MDKLFRKRKGFTLAETLITLMVIGIVAALTIPALVTKIQDTVLAKQVTTANSKIAEGFNQMRVDGKLMEKYSTTENFVKAMQGYFKISQTCDNNNLANCFVSTISYTSDDETKTKNVSELTTGASVDSSTYGDYKNFVGIKFSDGVNMLITYKSDCVGPKDSDGSAGTSTVGAYATCFGYFMDVNADKSPNKQASDIISNMTFAEADYYVVNGTGIPTPMSKADCQAFTAAHPDLNPKGCPYELDYWIGAVKACYDKNMHLPDESELTTIRNDLSCTNIGGCTTTPTVSPYKELWEENGGYFFLWSSELYLSNKAYIRVFRTSYSRYQTVKRSTSNVQAVCFK